MREKRDNQPVRVQAEKWFEALRAHFAAQQAQGDVAERLRAWATFEDLLGDCPRLLPPLLTMAWQLRHQPAFAELFQTQAGQIAEETTAPLTPHGKSFEQVIQAQLHGAMRAYCERQEKAWLATEKIRHRPSWITTVPLIGPVMRRLLRQRDQDIVRKYAHHGLYLALKPWLRHPRQFALIEALAILPTSAVGVLGDTIRGLALDSSIRNLAALESRKCKFIVGLARLFAETVVADADAARAAGTATDAMASYTRDNMAEIAGMALSQLTKDGLHLAKGAIAIQEQARDVVIKTSVPLGPDLWRVFTDRASTANIVACPPALVRAIGANACAVQRKTSEALASLPQQRIVESIVMSLLAAAGPEALTTWVTAPQCVLTWLKVVAEIKQVVTQRGEGAVTPESVAAYCQSLVPVFTALCAPAETTESMAPTAEAPASHRLVEKHKAADQALKAIMR